MSKGFRIIIKLAALVALVLVGVFLLGVWHDAQDSAAAWEEYYDALDRAKAEAAAAAAAVTPEPAEAALPAENVPQAVPAAAATPEPTPSPEPTPEVVTVSLIGDCTLASYPEIRGLASSFENVVESNWGYPFSNAIRYLATDDFTIGNLECCLSDSTAWSGSTFSFLAPAAAVNILTLGSVEYVTTANNHALDFGTDIYDESCGILDKAGIGHSGEGEYSLYETRGGVKIGVYSVFNYYSPETGAMAKAIAALREQGAEIVIVAVHWGTEGTYYQTGDQEKAGRAAIDAGADVVYGSHPHRLQPVEEYNGGLIFYSMANWCFGGNTNPVDKDTAIAQIMYERDTDGTLKRSGVELIPCSISSVADANDYRPTAFEEGTEEYERAMSKITGTFSGANTMPDYSFMHTGEEG